MRRSTFLLAFVVALASCTSTGDGRNSPSSDRALKVAFLEDLSLENATSMVVPAFQGAKLAIDAAARNGLGVELVGEDTGGDPAKAAEIAQELVTDPSVMAVIIGPFSTGLGQAPSTLVDGGMPVFSLSTISPFSGSAPPATWFDAVGGEVDEADVLAGQLEAAGAGGSICLSDAGRSGGTLTSLLAARVHRPTTVKVGEANGEPDFRSAVAEIADAGCSVLFWNGSGLEAARLRRALDAVGLGAVTLFGADQMKDPEFLSEAGAPGDGTVVVCACVDISTSTGIAARRFIQDFQANFGLPPGPYAAEAYDVGTIIADVSRSGEITRSEVLDALRGDRACLAQTCGSGGRLVPSFGITHLFIDEGGRWIPLASA